MNVSNLEILYAVEAELTSANEKHPPFASLHEAYAVIKEELEEAEEELVLAKRVLNYAWHSIRCDDVDMALENIDYVRECAEQLAMEACQVAAMCIKAVQSETGRMEDMRGDK